MMKRIKNKLLVVGACAAVCVLIYACKKSFLDRPPIGQISDVSLNNKDGVNGLLIGAYSLLDGSGIDNWFINVDNTSVWNPWAGSITADDAHKGGGYGSQTERSELEGKTYTAQNPILHDRWRYYYGGAQRANEAIRVLDKVPAGEFTTDEALQVRAEARFLRGVYHLMAALMWRNIPYVDETVTFTAGNYKVSNQPPGYAWARIEDDFKFAADNLTPTKAQVGRANKWAAKGLLAKTYMQQGKLSEAKPVLDDIIANGVTSKGDKFALLPEFSQLYRTQQRNGPESVFAVQMSVKDGADGHNGNEGESFNYPDGSPNGTTTGGWAHSPSFDLANAYRTQNGLPLLDTYNEVDISTDLGKKLTDPVAPYAGTLDPRLDWTLARRSLPFHDWGIFNQEANAAGGPFRGKKVVVWESDAANGYEKIDGWKNGSSINFNLVRFADVLLWAAECEVESGSLQRAEDLVNQVRARAANPAGFLKKYVDDDPSKGFSTTPAANYDITPYSGANGFTAQGKDYARKAVRFERRLELAMEGHRFFDLQRWDLAEPGYMANLLNKYMKEEVAKFEFYLPDPLTYDILKGKTFQKGKHEIFAIPQVQIDQSAEANGPTLIQNPGHN